MVVGECGVNGISGQQCSSEVSFLRQTDVGMVPAIAGFCDNQLGRCDCQSPFKGSACEEVHTAAMPTMFSIEKSKYLHSIKDTTIPDTLGDSAPEAGAYTELNGRIFNAWTFLAKTCWAANTVGALRVQLEFNGLMCESGSTCTLQNKDWTKPENLPSIVFYAHYNEAFETSVMESYFPDSAFNSGCRGDGGVYSEKLSCTSWDGEACLMDKTFQVSNTASEQTMIYIVIAGCGMRGSVMWNVSVVSPASEELSSVCGAKGTANHMRCYAEQGGTCQLQNPTKFSTSFVPIRKISRATVAIIAVCFVGSTVLGLIVIKVHQTRHKRARQRAALEQMTKAHYERNGLGPNGTDRIQPHFSSPQQAMTAEAMTGHVAISGGTSMR